MKAQILKIAGVKSEKEFYKKFPTEESFMAKHSKEVEKLLRKKTIGKAQIGWQETYAPQPIQVQDFDFEKNQKAIDRAANVNRRQALQQGIGLNSPQGVMDESIKMNTGLDKLTTDNLQLGFQAGSAIGGSVQRIQQAVQDKRRQRALQAVLPVVEQASKTREEQIARTYVRPDDPANFIQPGTLYNPLGYGTNILAAKNGTEIANTFAPNTIYTDLEKFEGGGVAAAALLPEAINMIGDLGAGLVSIGTKRMAKENEATLGRIGLQSGMQGIQNSQYVSHMKEGGMANPQVATSLEGIPLTRLFAPDPTMDTLRAGGHLKNYTPASERAMYTGRDQFAMGGDLRTHWGGKLKPLSNNPYQAGSGETVEIVGNSHDEKDHLGRTGVGISVGETGNSMLQDYAEFGTNTASRKASVEAENGEPVAEQMNPDGTMSAVVYGDLTMSKTGAQVVGDPSLAGGKIKNIVKKIALGENKVNKRIAKSIDSLDELNVNNPYDQLKFNSLRASIYGDNETLKDFAEKKEKIASWQEAINKTAEELGLKASDLAKGKVVQAKQGASIKKAKDGDNLSKKEREQNIQNIQDEIAKQMDALLSVYDENKGIYFTDPMLDEVLVTAPAVKPSDVPAQQQVSQEVPSQKFDWMTGYNMLRPYLRSRNLESLDPSQLMAESLALATNQLTPVQAQTIKPQLSTVSDISLEDIRQANEADYRAASRLFGYNPAALAALNAQKYQANQKVLGEQFRLNQAMRDKIYAENRDILNQTNLQNLGILDTQYGRQQEALSKTKATAQAALSSIAAKYAQKELENRTYATYANLFPNFDFVGKNMMAINTGLAQFNPYGSGMIGTSPYANATSDELEIIALQKKLVEKEQERLAKANKPKSSKNGSFVKATK